MSSHSCNRGRWCPRVSFEIRENIGADFRGRDRPAEVKPLGLIATPFLLFAGFGAVIFFLATAWLLSREYFALAAMRFRAPEEAKALRKRNAARVFIAGLFIAAFVSIPVVNLATPLFAVALMVHLHKRIGGPRLIAT